MMAKKGLDVEEKVLNQENKLHKIKDFSYTTKYFNDRKAQMDMVFNQIMPDLRELSEYFAPRMSRFLVNDVNKPIKRSKKILNSVTLTAVENFASGMQSGATSAASRWFKIQMSKKELNNIHEVRVWCSQVEDLFRRIYATSNFYQNMLGVYKQLGTFGFATLLMEADYNNVVNFKLLPIGSYRYAKDHRGNVDTVCRHFKEYARNIVDKYGYENCSESIKTAYDNNSDAQYEIVYFVEPNKQYKKDSPLAIHKKYISATYVIGEDEFLKLSGFDKFPFAVFETEVNGEDVYPSNCPGIEALPDAKQLMMETKEFSKALKKIVTPPYKGPATLQKYKGLMDAPGQIIPEDENGRGLTPMYEVKPQVLEVSNHCEKLEDLIKAHFRNDMFAVILNTADRGRTATEVNELKEEKMVLLSPMLDQVHKGLRYVQDFLFYQTVENGILPVPPKIIQKEEMKTEFVSALALAQKVKGIASIERFTTFTTNIAMAIDPTLLKKVHGDKIVDDYAEIANVNPEYVVPTEEVNKYREQLAQQQAQQEQLQQLQQGSEMIKNMGGVDAVGADLASRMGM